MLMAVNQDQIVEATDMSSTLLVDPRRYYFNTTQTGGFRVLAEDAAGGRINSDGIGNV